MPQNFQSSFIPKDPITPEVFKKKKAGIFGTLSVVLLISVIIISGALYAYKTIIKNDLINLEAELALAEKNIDKKTIDEMDKYSRKLTVVKSIILKHQVISGFLGDLSSSTVSTVSFTDFSYGSLNEGGLTVAMKGKADNFGSVVLQEEAFSKNKYWKEISFSGLAPGKEGSSGVSFDVSATIDPQIVVYAPPSIVRPTATSTTATSTTATSTATTKTSATSTPATSTKKNL